MWIWAGSNAFTGVPRPSNLVDFWFMGRSWKPDWTPGSILDRSEIKFHARSSIQNDKRTILDPFCEKSPGLKKGSDKHFKSVHKSILEAWFDPWECLESIRHVGDINLICQFRCSKRPHGDPFRDPFEIAYDLVWFFIGSFIKSSDPVLRTDDRSTCTCFSLFLKCLRYLSLCWLLPCDSQ